jgi:hypothetical protein
MAREWASGRGNGLYPRLASLPQPGERLHAIEELEAPPYEFEVCCEADAAAGQGRLVTPVDEFSGIPLPLSPMYMAERPSRYGPDDHHPWHERLDPRLQTLGGRALRSSRIQRANYDMHHLDYHGENFRGPDIPETVARQLRPIILGTAGYIPDKAISFSRTGEPLVVRLPDEFRKKLWEDKLIHVERAATVQVFLRQLILDQDLSDVKSSTVDEFLYTLDMARKREIGNDLLARATRRATSSVKQAYVQAYKSNLLPFDRPQTVSQFALAAVAMRRRRARLYSDLSQRLAS